MKNDGLFSWEKERYDNQRNCAIQNKNSCGQF